MISSTNSFNAFRWLKHPATMTLCVLLFLAITTAITYSVVQPGNIMGIDEWSHLYRVTQGSFEISNRPLTLLPLALGMAFVGADPVALHIITGLGWVVSALMVYFIVRLLAPTRPFFALACATVFVVYQWDDYWHLLMFLEVAGAVGITISTFGSLAAYFGYMERTDLSYPVRTVLLGIAIVLAVVAILIGEISMPTLLGVPLLVFALQRRFDKSRWFGLALMCSVVLLATGRYFLPILGLSDASYGSKLFMDVNPIRIAKASLVHIDFTFDSLIERASVRPIFSTVTILFAWLLIGLAGFAKFLSTDDTQPPLKHMVWLLGSFAVSWLGYCPYLLTITAEAPSHTHIISKPAEAVLLTSLIWLVADFVKHRGLRFGMQVAGIGYIAVAGVAMLALQQEAFVSIGATWEDTSHFMITLSEKVPDVQPQTLIIYEQVPDPHDTPFNIGATFQHAMRYFYEDRATGLVTIEYVFGTLEVMDEGILITEHWIEGEHLYEWDDIIVIARDSNKDVYIVDRLPEQYFTPQRQEQYDPYSRIKSGDVAPRFIEWFGSPVE